MYTLLNFSKTRVSLWGRSFVTVSQLVKTSLALWNYKVHCGVHNSLLNAPVLSQMNSIHTLKPYFCKVRFNIILLWTTEYLKHSVYFRGFAQTIECIYHHSHAWYMPRPSHLLDLVILTLSGEEIAKTLIICFYPPPSPSYFYCLRSWFSRQNSEQNTTKKTFLPLPLTCTDNVVCKNLVLIEDCFSPAYSHFYLILLRNCNCIL